MQDRLLQKHNEVLAFKESHSFTLGGERDDTPCCSKCHLRTGRGHNHLNCDLEKCVSYSFFGKIEKHPEVFSKSTLKKLEKEEIAVTKDINKLESELKVKEAALKSITNRFAYKVRKLLIMSNKDLYTKRLSDGTVIEVWQLINRDIKVLERKQEGEFQAHLKRLENIAGARQSCLH